MPGDAAAARGALAHRELRDQRHQRQGGLADPVPLLLARRVVGDGLAERREVGLELAAVVHRDEVLADVEDPLGDDPQLLVVPQLEDLERLALEHQRAARRGPHDVHARARERREPLREPVHVGPRVVEQPVGLEREAAAALLGHVDREPVVLEQRDRHLAEPRLVVVRPAAVEERDAPRRRRERLVLARPALERAAGEARHRRVAVQVEQALGEHAQRLVAERPVRQRRDRRPEPPGERRPRDDAVAQRHALRRLELRPRLRVDLRDVHALRAHLGADPAAGAVVERRVGRRALVGAEALRLRPRVLRPREQRGDVGDGAERLADRALHAVVERVAHQQRPEHVVAHASAPRADAAALVVAASTSSAARYPVARLMPSPDFSFHGSAPASVAPATSTFS